MIVIENTLEFIYNITYNATAEAILILWILDFIILPASWMSRYARVSE